MLNGLVERTGEIISFREAGLKIIASTPFGDFVGHDYPLFNVRRGIVEKRKRFPRRPVSPKFSAGDCNRPIAGVASKSTASGFSEDLCPAEGQ